jgi:hypothetical protein
LTILELKTRSSGTRKKANVECAVNGVGNVPTCEELDGNWEQDLYKTVTNKSEEDTIALLVILMKKNVLKYHQYQLMNVCI